MNKFKTILSLIVLLLFLFNHLLIGQSFLNPLGYKGVTKAFIKYTHKTAVYNAFKNKVLKEFDYDADGDIYHDSIFYYSSNVDIDRGNIFSGRSMRRKFGILNLSSGKDTGLQFDFAKVYNDSIFVEKDLEWYLFNSNFEFEKFPRPLPWDRNNKKYKWKFIVFEGIGALVFNKKSIWAKDSIVVDKRKKEIWLRSYDDFHSINGCKDLLLYHKNKEIFIDTFGNIVPVNSEYFSNDYSCCKIFNRYKDLKKKFSCSKQIRKQLNEEIVRSDSISPDYRILKNKAGEILIERDGKRTKTKFTGYRFIKYHNALLVQDSSGWYLMNAKMQKGIKVTNKTHFTQYSKGYVSSKNEENKYNLFDLIHKKFVFKEYKDSIMYRSGDYLWYKDKGVWYKLTMDYKNKVRVKVDSIIGYNDFFIYYKYHNKYYLTNTNLQIIRLENEENIELLRDKPFYIRYNSKNKNLKHYYNKNNKILPLSNIYSISKLRNGDFLISYESIVLYDSNQDSIKNINNFLGYNKELYKTYDEDFDTICYDFEGKKIKCKLDSYERIFKAYQSNLSADSAISSFGKILANYPDEEYAFQQILFIRITEKLPKHLDLDKIKENINTLNSKVGYKFTGLDLVLKLIDGIQRPSKRKQIIYELKKLRKNEISKKERFFHPAFEQNYKNLINYYIGYLYFLDSNIGESEKYKKISTKESNELLNETIFNLY